jgi:hypothetical protein
MGTDAYAHATLIRRRMVDVIDPNNVDRRLPGFQFESELLANGREQRRGAFVATPGGGTHAANQKSYSASCL